MQFCYRWDKTKQSDLKSTKWHQLSSRVHQYWQYNMNGQNLSQERGNMLSVPTTVSLTFCQMDSTLMCAVVIISRLISGQCLWNTLVCCDSKGKCMWHFDTSVVTIKDVSAPTASLMCQPDTFIKVNQSYQTHL